MKRSATRQAIAKAPRMISGSRPDVFSFQSMNAPLAPDRAGIFYMALPCLAISARALRRGTGRQRCCHVAPLGGRPGPVLVADWSAGGNIAAITCQLARDRGGAEIAGQLLICPV